MSHEKCWLSGYTHHTCGRRPEVRIPGVSSSALPMSALAMASLLCSPHLWQGGLRHELQLSISCVLSPPASYIGLACQDGYIALRWINFESYDNLRKISSNLFNNDHFALKKTFTEALSMLCKLTTNKVRPHSKWRNVTLFK